MFHHKYKNYKTLICIFDYICAEIFKNGRTHALLNST